MHAPVREKWKQHIRVFADIRDTSHVPAFLHPTRWIPRDLFSDRYDATALVYSSAAPRTVPDSLLSTRRFLSEIHGCLSYESHDDQSIYSPIGGSNVPSTPKTTKSVIDYTRFLEQTNKLRETGKKLFACAIQRARLKIFSIFYFLFSNILCSKFLKSIHVCLKYQKCEFSLRIVIPCILIKVSSHAIETLLYEIIKLASVISTG